MSRDNGPDLNHINESLAVDTQEIAKAISEYFLEMGTLKQRGFALFIADYPTGKISYVSDINHDDAVGMIAMWVAREHQ